MSYTKFFVEHYDKLSETEWNTGYTLLDAHDVDVRSQLGDKKNTFTFKLLNPNDKYSTFFSTNDKINIYGVSGSDSYSSSNILMSGVIKKINREKDFIRVEGVDYSEVILSGLIFVDGSGKNPMQIIQLAINDLNSKNSATALGKKFYISWNSGNPDGSSLPTVEQGYEFYKSALSVVEKYLGPEYNSGKRFYWYINTSNEFVVREKTDVLSTVNGSTVTLNEQDFYDVNDDVDNSEVKNFVIIKAGYSPDMKNIQSIQQNTISMVKHGFKPHIEVANHLSEDLLEQEKVNNYTLFDEGSRFPNAYPYTTYWKSSETDSENSPNTTAGSTVTIASDIEFEYAFKREIRWQADKRGQNIINLYDKGYLKVVGSLPHNFYYQVGQLIYINIPRFELNDKKLRIHECRYTKDSLTINAQEDEATI